MINFSILILLPASLSLASLFILFLMKDKLPCQKSLIWFLLGCAVNFYVDALALFVNHSDYEEFVFLVILMSFTSSVISPLWMNYGMSLAGINRTRVPVIILGISAFSVFIVTLSSFFFVGPENAVLCFKAFQSGSSAALFESAPSLRIFSSAFTASFLLLLFNHILAILFTIHILYRNAFTLKMFLSFWRGQFSPSPINLTSFCSLILFIAITVSHIASFDYLYAHPLVASIRALTFAVPLYFGSLIGIAFPGTRVNIHELLRPFDRDGLIPDRFADRTPPLRPGFKGRNQTSSPAPYPLNDIKKRYDEYMNENQAFLDPCTTVQSVADALNTNRTYLSMMINQVYGKTFPEHINGMRVNYAKKLILDNPNASFADVASKSGFASDSQFSRKFKEITGQQPSAWRNLHVRT